MHTALQSGGRSPKPLNGPSGAQQLKSGSESDHNTGPSLPSHSKSKKRDRSDQCTEPIKRERPSKPDDGDSIDLKSDNMIKAEIVKITEKGGLVSSEGVEKLVYLMQLDRTDKKIDVASRILVADVIAATDRYDCLNRFTCNIGKSVNHLRTHKNPEIQKKARSLIDTWKKRVDAEFAKISDAKSVASGQPVWQVKPGSSDVSHAGSRRAGSTDMTSKSPVTPTTLCKTLPSKPGHSDVIVKSETQGTLKMGSTLVTSVPAGSKDSLCKASANTGAEMLPTAVKEEKSSSSSQSQNNSQSYSSDHAKTVGSSWKEDTRSSSAGSINATKVAGGSSRHRKSSNGVMGTSTSGSQKETNSSKSGSLYRATAFEKSSQSGLTCDNPIDLPSWQSNDVKELPVGVGEAPRAVCSSFGNEKGILCTESKTSSFSSINALIDSCVKYSEASASLAVEDDGMNLLASVAAGEISKSDLISPTGSPGASPATEDPSTEAKSRLSSDDDAAQSNVKLDEAADADSIKQGKTVGSILTRDVSYLDGTNFSRNNGTDEERDGNFSVFKPAEVDKRDSDGASILEEKQMTDMQVLDHYTGCKLKETSLSAEESKPIEYAHQKIEDGSICTSEIVFNDGDDLDIAVSGIKSEKLVVEESQSCPTAKRIPEDATSSDQQQHLRTESAERSVDAGISLDSPDVTSSKDPDKSRICKPDDLSVSHLESNDKQGNNSLNSSKLDESVRPAISSCGAAVVVEDLKVKESHKSSSMESASQEPPSSFTAQETERRSKSAGPRVSGAVADVREDLASSVEASSLAVEAAVDVASKLDFDLNEGIIGDDGNQFETAVSVSTVCSSTVHLPNLSPFANSTSTGLPAPITVAAPAKGPFVPPENLLRSKGEPGWKGSAATSAFRPAEPRKVLEMPLNTPGMLSPSDFAGKQCRPLLDIDLNEPDEGVLEDMANLSSAKTMGSESGTTSNLDASPRISGGLDLDLNRVDEGMENGQFLACASHGMAVPLLSVGPASAEFPNRESNMLRDFDLNNGPGPEELCSEPITRSQNTKNTSSVPFLPPVANVRMNAVEAGSVSSWFPPGSSYPAVAIPSFLSNRGEQSYPIVAAQGAQRILGPVTASGPFGGDVYRGPVLSSSPAMAFTPAFPYAGFTFGSNFPLASNSYSGASASFGGAIGGSNNTRKWISSGLDLNSGPGNADMEGKDERLPLASRQLLVATSQAFTEEQLRMYAVVPGGGLKRKEPEGGWDADRSAYKQLSWQ
ncbi:unnamed protein product [Musa acuminata subsp. malaccensis]|uniref:(wild Malaysian banana) hypothetical protein n=1 Tax=Musa acuminata subsp. malaccensis TaxID=214687 RepID=A0A804KKS2_MUSAM|nr:unnamed protein product [Musa acuminata subsp. malaccensis]